MDWQVFATTFTAIFLAEMGDKTQLAAMTLAASSQRPWTVLLAAALALAAVSAIGVGLGTAVGAYLPIVWIKRAAGGAFVAVGVLMIAGRM